MASRYLDLTGHRYGQLTVLRLSPIRTNDGKARWECRCDCGAMATVDARNLRSGSISSCGCYRTRRMAQMNTTHGLSKTVEHEAWRQLRSRCSNPRNRNFANYGARGILVAPEWDSFERFYADMGPRPSRKHSIDRIDNDGPYAPGNCRWATAAQQRRNTRSNTFLTHQGRTHTVTDWATEIGLDVNTLCARLTKGWSVHRALTTPLHIASSHPRRQA